MKKCFIALSATLLIGCASDPIIPVTTEPDSQGNTVRQTAYLTQEQYVDSKISEDKRECQKALYGQSEKMSDAKDILLFNAFNALNPKDPCPTVATNNDVKIVKTQERYQSLRHSLNKLVPIFGIWAGKEVGETAVSERDPLVVEQPEPIIVEQPEPIIITPASPE